MCCFSTKQAVLRRKSKGWLARDQDDASEWGLFNELATIEIQLSEWLLFNANSAIFQLIFNEMMMRSTLYLNNTLSWISIVASSLMVCVASPLSKQY
jgi:hypothetical protein